MMNRGENSDSIPTDLILEIFSRLPAKSVARFRCVSKLWWSMLSRPYFTDLFLTMSSARPRLLFAVCVIQNCEWNFFSVPQPQNPYGKSSLVVAVDSHMKFSGGISQYSFSYAAGLIYLHNMWIPKEDKDAKPVICNPITGQYAILPKLRTNKASKPLLGFDPIDKEFKLLSMHNTYNETFHYTLTLGNGKMRWRNIQCSLFHYPLRRWEGICINGVLYYLAYHFDEMSPYSTLIVCFDVRSEKSKFIGAQCFRNVIYKIKLINFKGKLGGISLTDDYDSGMIRTHRKLCMWVLEDVEKQEWSKYVYTLPKHGYLDIVGFTAAGELVFSLWNPFHVFYFNCERNILQSVEIQGFGNDRRATRVCAFIDHVEDLNLNIMSDNICCNIHKPTRTEA